jgi:isopentenyldiphosphate isomerase
VESSATELIDVVDEHDRVLGQATRGEVYARGLIHRCAVAFVTDPAGRLFVHRRAAAKAMFPSLYDMGVGGVVGAGESYDDAAWREAGEELGVTGLPRPAPLFRFRYGTVPLSWWIAAYELTWDGPVAPPADEIGWWAWLPPSEVDSLLERWEWVPDGVEVYRRLRLHRAGRS